MSQPREEATGACHFILTKLHKVASGQAPISQRHICSFLVEPVPQGPSRLLPLLHAVWSLAQRLQFHHSASPQFLQGLDSFKGGECMRAAMALNEPSSINSLGPIASALLPADVKVALVGMGMSPTQLRSLPNSTLSQRSSHQQVSCRTPLCPALSPGQPGFSLTAALMPTKLKPSDADEQGGQMRASTVLLAGCSQWTQQPLSTVLFTSNLLLLSSQQVCSAEE